MNCRVGKCFAMARSWGGGGTGGFFFRFPVRALGAHVFATRVGIPSKLLTSPACVKRERENGGATGAMHCGVNAMIKRYYQYTGALGTNESLELLQVFTDMVLFDFGPTRSMRMLDFQRSAL